MARRFTAAGDRALAPSPTSPTSSTGAHALLAATLDRSAHRVRAGAAPPTRTVHGGCTVIGTALARLRHQARREVLTVDEHGYLMAVGCARGRRRPAEDGPVALTGPAVQVRQVTTGQALQVGGQLGAGTLLEAAETRVVQRVPLNLMVLDRQVALVPVDVADPMAGFTIVRHPGVIAALVAVHENLWTSGVEPQSRSEGPPASLAPVLPALAGGEPDEVVCRRLRMSSRTYSRRVAELLELLGARTRFQAGIEAARRGWL